MAVNVLEGLGWTRTSGQPTTSVAPRSRVIRMLGPALFPRAAIAECGIGPPACSPNSLMAFRSPTSDS
jgi:hypothetical protein